MRTLRLGLLALVVASATGCSGLAHVDSDMFRAARRDHISFWGHACFDINIDGVGIVTDPVFEKSLLSRHRMIGRPPESALSDVRVVLISHAHVDHLSPESLEIFPKDTVVLCPVPSAKYVVKTGLEVRAMHPGEEMQVGDVTIVAVAAHHPGNRWGVRSAADGRALGFVIRSPRSTVFYSGDSNYFSGFSHVGWTYSPDVALINVNGHLKPPDAARAAWATQARIVVPGHWGAYGYWLVGGNKRPRGESELHELLGDRLRVLEPGQSLAIPARHALP